MPRCMASRYEPDLLTAKCVNNNQDDSRATHAYRNKPFFIFCIRVQLMDRQRVEKHAFSIREGHSMLFQITYGFWGGRIGSALM